MPKTYSLAPKFAIWQPYGRTELRHRPKNILIHYHLYIMYLSFSISWDSGATKAPTVDNPSLSTVLTWMDVVQVPAQCIIHNKQTYLCNVYLLPCIAWDVRFGLTQLVDMPVLILLYFLVIRTNPNLLYLLGWMKYRYQPNIWYILNILYCIYSPIYTGMCGITLTLLFDTPVHT